MLSPTPTGIGFFEFVGLLSLLELVFLWPEIGKYITSDVSVLLVYIFNV